MNTIKKLLKLVLTVALLVPSDLLAPPARKKAPVKKTARKVDPKKTQPALPSTSVTNTNKPEDTSQKVENPQNQAQKQKMLNDILTWIILVLDKEPDYKKALEHLERDGSVKRLLTCAPSHVWNIAMSAISGVAASSVTCFIPSIFATIAILITARMLLQTMPTVLDPLNLVPGKFAVQWTYNFSRELINNIKLLYSHTNHLWGNVSPHEKSVLVGRTMVKVGELFLGRALGWAAINSVDQTVGFSYYKNKAGEHIGEAANYLKSWVPSLPGLPGLPSFPTAPSAEEVVKGVVKTVETHAPTVVTQGTKSYLKAIGEAGDWLSGREAVPAGHFPEPFAGFYPQPDPNAVAAVASEVTSSANKSYFSTTTQWLTEKFNRSSTPELPAGIYPAEAPRGFYPEEAPRGFYPQPNPDTVTEEVSQSLGNYFGSFLKPYLRGIGKAGDYVRTTIHGNESK